MEHRVHQDYIVRQRFSNALPPPPGAPKLLDIPTGGLKQYTMPPYASRLARLHPLNIEADADLGMPIDLVGMPGVFEGDESSILAPLKNPPIHPADEELLRPLKMVGQAKKEKDISFLRRTQFTAEGGLRQAAPSTYSVVAPKRRRLDTSQEDPKAILRNAIKGFDIANPGDVYSGPDTADKVRGAQPTPAELEAWKRPKHPSNPNLKPIDYYPVLPDMDAITLDGGFMVTRFQGNPADNRDKSKDSGLSQGDQRSEALMNLAMLRVLDPDPEAVEEYQRRVDKYEEDPEKNKHPGEPPLQYEVFLPQDSNVLNSASRAFDVDATPEDQISHLYTSSDPHPHFRFARARLYQQRAGTQTTEHPYEWVGVVLNDGEDEADDKLDDDLGLGDDDDEDDVENGDRAANGSRRKRKLQKAAYFAPVASTAQLRPKRGATDKFGQITAREEDQIDILELRVNDERGDEKEARTRRAASLEPGA